MSASPYLIYFDRFGHEAEGFLTVASEADGLPFVLKRSFWTYATPADVKRGRHAHRETEMVVIALHGRVRIETETLYAEKQVFVLDRPFMGLYIPTFCWHELIYDQDAVQLVLTSTLYEESDYIRDINTFRSLQAAAAVNA